jgi:hypothetical protein
VNDTGFEFVDAFVAFEADRSDLSDTRTVNALNRALVDVGLVDLAVEVGRRYCLPGRYGEEHASRQQIARWIQDELKKGQP